MSSPHRRPILLPSHNRSGRSTAASPFSWMAWAGIRHVGEGYVSAMFVCPLSVSSECIPRYMSVIFTKRYTQAIPNRLPKPSGSIFIYLWNNFGVPNKINTTFLQSFSSKNTSKKIQKDENKNENKFKLRKKSVSHLWVHDLMRKKCTFFNSRNPRNPNLVRATDISILPKFQIILL